jgi:hypothetical protein
MPLSCNLGTLTSLNPLSHSRPVTGLLYLYLLPIYIFDYISLRSSVLLSTGNTSDKRCRENQNTPFVISNFFLENHAGYEIMWKNILEAGRPQTTAWRMRIACWINKATYTQPHYVMLTVFPMHQWLYGRTPMLSYLYIA